MGSGAPLLLIYPVPGDLCLPPPLTRPPPPPPPPRPRPLARPVDIAFLPSAGPVFFFRFFFPPPPLHLNQDCRKFYEFIRKIMDGPGRQQGETMLLEQMEGREGEREEGGGCCTAEF